MKTNLVRQGRYLLDDSPENIGLHHLLGPNYFRTEAALEIADIADLDIDLFEPFACHRLAYNTPDHSFFQNKS